MQLYFIHFYLFYRYAFKQHQLLPYSKYLLYRFTLFLFFNTHPCTLFISSKNQLGVETGADSEQRIPTVRVLGKNIRVSTCQEVLLWLQFLASIRLPWKKIHRLHLFQIKRELLMHSAVCGLPYKNLGSLSFCREFQLFFGVIWHQIYKEVRGACNIKNEIKRDKWRTNIFVYDFSIQKSLTSDS